MRSLALFLVLFVTMMPAARAQQPVVATSPVAQGSDDVRRLEQRSAATGLKLSRFEVGQAEESITETAAARQVSVRNLFTIIGVVVVVVALVSLLS
jgi:hypothetical protein